MSQTLFGNRKPVLKNSDNINILVHPLDILEENVGNLRDKVKIMADSKQEPKYFKALEVFNELHSGLISIRDANENKEVDDVVASNSMRKQ